MKPPKISSILVAKHDKFRRKLSDAELVEYVEYDQPSVCWNFLQEMYLAICKARASWPRSWAALTAVSPTLIDNWMLIFPPQMKGKMRTLYSLSTPFESEMYINSSARVQWWPTMFWYFVSAPAFKSSSTIAEWPALQTGHGSDEVDHFAQKKGNFSESNIQF